MMELWSKSRCEERHRQRRSPELYQHEKWYAKLLKGLEIVEKGNLLVLLGDRGTGKTQMGVELIRLLNIQSRPGLYIRCREIGMRLREAYDSRQLTEKQAILEFARPYLLVIDECQERPDKDFEIKSINMLVDLRYAAIKPTVLIANCTEPQFKDLVGASVIDRIKEGGGALMCDWPSFRKGK